MQEPVDLIVTGGQVVSPSGTRAAGIAVRDGRVVAVGEEAALPPARERIDVQGKHVLPGIVDPEAHLGTPVNLGDAIRSETRAAATAGVTTWGFQHTSPVLSRVYKEEKTLEDVVPFSQAMPTMLELADGASMVDWFFTPIVTTDEQCLEISRLAEEFGINSFKLYLHTRSGARSFSNWPIQKAGGYFGLDDGVVYLAFEQAAALGAGHVVSIHPENWEIASLFRDRLIAAGRTDMEAWNDYSPHFCEAGHIRTYAYYAGITGCHLYIQHTSTPESLVEIQRASGEGLKVTAQSGPHYLCLPAGTWKINVPLRDPSVFPALWQALADDTINALGSDHVNRSLPRSEMWKDNVWETISGFPSRVEMALPLMLSEGVNKGRITLERLVAVMCENPARAFAIYPKKGTIQVGADADFVVVDLDKTLVERNDRVHTATGWTVIDGWELKGWPVMTILRGRVTARWSDASQRNEVEGQPDGRYIPRRIGQALHPLERVAETAATRAT